MSYVGKQRVYASQTPNLLDPINLQRVLRTIEDRLFALDTNLTAVIPTITGGTLLGTHEARLKQYNPTKYKGSIFFETDRTVFYFSDGQNWKYLGGRHACALTAIPTDLDDRDTGFLLNTTTYNHLHIWSGSAWGWGDGDSGSAYVALHTINPGTGWKLCDGLGTYTYEKADCTTGTRPVNDVRTYYPKFGSTYTGNLVPAVAHDHGAVTGAASGTLSTAGTGATNAYAAHTHSIASDSTAEPPSTLYLPYFRQ